MRKILSLALLTIFLTVIGSSSVMAARSSTTTLGNDISWPQCGKKLPNGQAFGIVGVNGGLANTTNSCLSTQLLWANKSTGVTNQPKTQLYVNTANPGGLGTPSWPFSNVDSLGNTAPNPYGTCDGSDSLACGWQYGWNRAVEDVHIRFKPAAQAVNLSDNPTSYRWWLDVETENTWKTGSFGLQSNAADLEGMTAYLKTTLGAQVGLYSTSYQWGLIVGPLSSSSNLNGLDSWLPGAGNQTGAKNNCSLPPLTAGGKVTLTQFVSRNLDYDYSCA